MAKKPHRRTNIAGYAGGLLCLVIIVAGVTFIVRWQKDKARQEEAAGIVAYGPRAGVPKTIDDLKAAIAQYEKALEKQVETAAQTGTYWKILGTRYRDKGMHLEAMDAFEHALRYATDEETLHYLLGLEAVQAGKSLYAEGPEAQRGYFDLAEKAQKRALELAGNYTQAYYALASLYVFDLDRPLDAIPLLEKYMEGRSGDATAMFIMARAYYMAGQPQAAIDWYKRGIPYEKDKDRVAEAEANIRYIQNNAAR